MSFCPDTAKLISLFPSTPPLHLTPLKIKKLTREKMVERQLKVLCYNCDDKYFWGHKCKEQKFFMAISKDVFEYEIEASHATKLPQPTPITLPSHPPEVEPVISLNALTGFFVPQTLKLIGYIKKHKVNILIDSGSTHNFIHRHISQQTHCYIHAVNNFQIMIVDGGFMKCGEHCENVCLQIVHYNLKYHVSAIHMGGCDIVLRE
jgi:hypothetical protein